jgi:undecaprenyl-diphosphatase UppP
MENQSLFDALLLGLLEGLTEFIPVSSTGHILLAGHFLGFESTGKAFEVLIQLGAILALLSVYAGRLVHMLIDLPRDRATQRFVAGILLAFLPAAVIGALAHDFIKTVLFETPKLICIMLILGGFVLMAVDRMPLNPRYTNVGQFPLRVCFVIGVFQCLAMIPGTSRSGSTIVGALLMGADKRSPSGWPCRPWPGPSPTISSRTATSSRQPTCRSSRPVSSPPSSWRSSSCGGCSATSRATVTACSPGGAWSSVPSASSRFTCSADQNRSTSPRLSRSSASRVRRTRNHHWNVSSGIRLSSEVPDSVPR